MLVFFSSLFLRRVWQRLIVRWTTAMFLSHPAIDRFPVDSFIFFCCSTLFAIAFLCDLKYVSRMLVSDFKNVFRCTKRNSSSGRAFFLYRCSFLISVWSCLRLKLSLFLLLFLSSPWTSLFLCSQTLIWKRSNSSIIFAHIISVPPTWTQPIPGRTYSKRFRKMFVFIFISDIIHSWTM